MSLSFFFNRYLLSVNVIGFMYSAFQFSAELHQLFTRKHFISRPIGYCFNLAMDQARKTQFLLCFSWCKIPILAALLALFV